MDGMRIQMGSLSNEISSIRTTFPDFADWCIAKSVWTTCRLLRPSVIGFSPVCKHSKKCAITFPKASGNHVPSISGLISRGFWFCQMHRHIIAVSVDGSFRALDADFLRAGVVSCVRRWRETPSYTKASPVHRSDF